MEIELIGLGFLGQPVAFAPPHLSTRLSGAWGDTGAHISHKTWSAGYISAVILPFAAASCLSALRLRSKVGL